MNRQIMDRIIDEINANSSWVDDWGEEGISIRDLMTILKNVPVM